MTPFSNVMLMVAGKTMLKDMLLVGGVVLVTTSLLMAYRKRRRRTMANHVTPHEQISQMQQQRGMRGDLEDLMVEIEQLAKRLGSQLDAKSIQLEQALSEADRRIEQLQSLTQREASADRWSNSPNARMPEQIASSNGDPPNESLAKAVYGLADQGLDPDEIAKRLNELVGKIELILALRRP